MYTYNNSVILICRWLIDLAKCGFPRKKSDLLCTVQKIVKADGRERPFKDGLPGKGWYKVNDPGKTNLILWKLDSLHPFFEG